MEFPISISEAARELDIPKSTASILVKTHRIPTEPNPVNPRAKMLGRPSYARLARKAAPFRPAEEAAAAG